MPMEMLPINDDSGQGYGFTLYQAQLEKAADEITIHKVSDRAQVGSPRKKNQNSKSKIKTL